MNCVGLNINYKAFGKEDKDIIENVQEWLDNDKTHYAKSRLLRCDLLDLNLFEYKNSKGYAFFCEKELVGVVVTNEVYAHNEPKSVHILKMCAIPEDGAYLIENDMIYHLLKKFKDEGFHSIDHEYVDKDERLTEMYRKFGFKTAYQTSNKTGYAVIYELQPAQPEK